MKNVKKKSLKRKALSLALMGAMLVSVKLCENTFAANVTDTAWSYNIGGDSNNTAYTQSRNKTDKSKAYIKLERFTGKSDDQLIVEMVKENYGVFSKRYTRALQTQGKYSLTNYAYEDNKCTAPVRIKMKSNTNRWFYTWTASGQWSPDSTRVYD